MFCGQARVKDYILFSLSFFLFDFSCQRFIFQLLRLLYVFRVAFGAKALLELLHRLLLEAVGALLQLAA